MDSSSTALALAARMELNYKTVVTNNLQTAMQLSKKPDVNLILLGGSVQFNTNSATGSWTARQLKDFSFDLMIASCAAVIGDEAFERSLDQKKSSARRWSGARGGCLWRIPANFRRRRTAPIGWRRSPISTASRPTLLRPRRCSARAYAFPFELTKRRRCIISRGAQILFPTGFPPEERAVIKNFLFRLSALCLAASLSGLFFFFARESVPKEGASDRPVRILCAAADTPDAAPVWNTSDADISRIDPNRKLVAFTFDDAPDSTLNALVKVFADFNGEHPECPASATFFCNGIRMDGSTLSPLKKAFKSGFELGNHTYSHKDLTRLSSEDIRKEMETVDGLLQKIDGKSLHLVRVPYGNFDDKVRKEAKAPLIDWTIDTEDWKGISPEAICKAVYDGLRPGAIVLMHDGYKNTVEAAKRLLPELEKRGYQTVTVSQLSKALGFPLAAGKVYSRFR